jgi:protein phosphatase
VYKTPKILTIPGSALVVLIGPAGSGKSTFARGHFLATEILSSDYFRGLVSDDEGDQDATSDAFTLLHLVLEKRLSRGKLCLVDATNTRADFRKRLIECAQLFQRAAVAVVFETPVTLCLERAASRHARMVSAAVIRQQVKEVALQHDEDLLREGFTSVFRFDPADQLETRRTSAASRSK